LAEIRVGFLRVFGYRLETGHEIGNDLQRQEDGEKRTGVKGGLKIPWSAADAADTDERDENKQNHGRHSFLEVGAEADAAVVDGGEKQRESRAQDEAREENRLARDAIQLERIKRRENVAGDFSEGDGFPRAHDEVGEKHHPTSEVAYDGRENLRGVGGFAGSVGKALDPLAVDVANRKQNDAADGKSERRARRTSSSEPIVHEDEPSGANHGAEREGKVVVQTKFASERSHLQDAEQFVEEIRGKERSDFAGVVGRGDLDEVAADNVQAAQGTNEFQDLDAG